MTTDFDIDRRYLMALYYAYGRLDADIANGRDWPFEPIVFAEHYCTLYTDMVRGESSGCPSVQDAYVSFARREASRQRYNAPSPAMRRLYQQVGLDEGGEQ